MQVSGRPEGCSPGVPGWFECLEGGVEQVRRRGVYWPSAVQLSSSALVAFEVVRIG